MDGWRFRFSVKGRETYLNEYHSKSDGKLKRFGCVHSTQIIMKY